MNRVEVTRKVPMDGKLLLDEESGSFDRRFAVCLRIRCQRIIKDIHFLGTVNGCLVFSYRKLRLLYEKVEKEKI